MELKTQEIHTKREALEEISTQNGPPKKKSIN
jgi:hypothetical protein